MREPAPPDPSASVPSDWDWQAVFDGKETECGEVLLDLRNHVRPLEPGSRILIHFKTAGASVEMPAWCRLTGHRLIAAQHPYYLVEIRIDHEPPSRIRNRSRAQEEPHV